MDKQTERERRRQERRWRERRAEDHPVFLDTRLPWDRRGGDRRNGAGAAEPPSTARPRR